MNVYYHHDIKKNILKWIQFLKQYMFPFDFFYSGPHIRDTDSM